MTGNVFYRLIVSIVKDAIVAYAAAPLLTHSTGTQFKRTLFFYLPMRALKYNF